MKRTTYLIAILTFFLSVVFAEDFSIKGVVKNSSGDKTAKITVLLLGEERAELQRTTTSKLPLLKGNFTFKKVMPGDYTLEAKGGDMGKAFYPVTVVDADVKDIALTLTVPKEPISAEGPPPVDEVFTIETGEIKEGPAKDYLMNELSFEIKKMAAEIKHLNTELKDLKALSKMWVNPLAIYSKEIILKNGSTVFGKIIYQDDKTLKIETLVGYLIIERTNIVRVIDNIVTEEQQEYVPEQIRDSYTPPPMPKLAEPKYTSPSPLARDAGRQFSANCVLMGNITEKKDNQGNIIFTGQIKNIGGRRSDFVKVDFVFRKNWSGETKTLTTFIRGGYHTFDSGITTDATLLPGATGTFELYVPHSFGSFIGYSYTIDWEEYE